MVLKLNKQKQGKRNWIPKLFRKKSKDGESSKSDKVDPNPKTQITNTNGAMGEKNSVEVPAERRSPTNITVTSSQESSTQNDRDVASDGSVPDINEIKNDADMPPPLHRKKSVSFRLPSDDSLASEEEKEEGEDISAAEEEGNSEISEGASAEEEKEEELLGTIKQDDGVKEVSTSPPPTSDNPKETKPDPAIQEIAEVQEFDEAPRSNSIETEVTTADSIDDEEEIQKKIQAIKDEMGNIQEKLSEISKEMGESKTSAESKSSAQGSGGKDDADADDDDQVSGSLMGFLLSPFKDTSGAVQFGASGVDMKANMTKSMLHPLVPVWQAKSEGAVIPPRYIDVEDQGAEETDPIGQVELVNLNLDEGEDANRQQLDSLPLDPSMVDDASQTSTFLIPVYSDSFDHASVGHVPDTIQKYESTGLFLKMLPPIKETSIDDAVSAAEYLFTSAQGVDWKGAKKSMRNGFSAFLGGVGEVSESVVKNTLLYDVMEGVEKKE